MEQHGKNTPQDVIAIIPARYSSTRLPGKMLLPIAGKPLLLHTVERAKAARSIDRVIVATDDQRIFDAVEGSGDEAVMTRGDHRSGSDRIAEVARELPAGSIIVNVQGDEPLISPETIDRTVDAFVNDPRAHIATTSEPVTSKHGELLNGNVVKVVVSDAGNALYFSRSPVPFPREASLRYGGDPGQAIDHEPDLLKLFRKHTGLYVYRREYLLEYTNLRQTRLEQIESLEQIRALENGARIKVVEAAGGSIGVDTHEDYERVRDIIEAGIDIRAATNDDLPRVASVHVDSWRRSFEGIVPRTFLQKMSVEQRLKAFSDREHNGEYTMLVAEHPSEGIVGFADFGTPKLPGQFDAQIFSFYVLPEFQRRGFGTRLFRRCVSQMRRSGTHTLCLDSLEVSPYRSFYDKAGGTVVGRDTHKLDGEDFATVIYGWDDITQI